MASKFSTRLASSVAEIPAAAIAVAAVFSLLESAGNSSANHENTGMMAKTLVQ